MEQNLIFYAIAYQYQEDIFYNFAEKKDIDILEHTCLLPTKEMAQQFIEDELSIDYTPVEITVYSYKSGELVFSRGLVSKWDSKNRYRITKSNVYLEKVLLNDSNKVSTVTYTSDILKAFIVNEEQIETYFKALNEHFGVGQFQIEEFTI
ncbi:hypothetical protein MZM54_03925 [[Brevibacterium] frigoritolerans]|nr:hypothetical protein [Peribacillus frigoritolerans]